MASKYYQWNDHQIHYRQSGLGDPLILVHGLYPGASSEEFDHNIRVLSRDFRVYAIDLLGFGLSDAPRLRYRADFYPQLLSDFIQDVIGAPAGLIAAGASAPFVATLAAEEPKLVSKVAFISPPGAESAFAGRWFGRVAREILRMVFLFPPLHLVFQEVIAGEWEIHEMLKRSFGEKTVIRSGVVERLSELARRPGVIDAYASLEVGLLSTPLQPILQCITIPTLFLSGNGISPQAAKELEHLSSLPKTARLEWIDRAAEWPHYEAPNSVNRLLAGFLGSEMKIEVSLGTEISQPAERLVA